MVYSAHLVYRIPVCPWSGSLSLHTDPDQTFIIEIRICGYGFASLAVTGTGSGITNLSDSKTQFILHLKLIYTNNCNYLLKISQSPGIYSGRVHDVRP